MNKDDLEHELEIAEHNLWVAKTEVEIRQEQVDRVKGQLRDLGYYN